MMISNSVFEAGLRMRNSMNNIRGVGFTKERGLTMIGKTMTDLPLTDLIGEGEARRRKRRKRRMSCLRRSQSIIQKALAIN
jgi:hypothetical protein